VIIENVTLKGSESWTLHLLACDEVLVSGIKIRNPLHGPNTDGIDIQACSNIRISNCDIYTRDDAIVMKNRYPKYYDKVCENITVTNIVAYGASSASSISSIPGYYVENVILKNILIETKGGGDKELAQKTMDEKIQAYPEGTMWGPMPVSGFYVRHVKGLQMSDITIIVGESDMRPLIKFDDVTDLYINNLQTNDTHKGDCILDFNNVKKANLINIDFPKTIKIPWLFFKGNETENIIVRTINNIQSKSFIKTDKSVREI
jgi:hypothetical protein